MFKIDDLVDVKEREDLTAYGKITKLIDEDGVKKAVVHFRLPREPKKFDVCDDCGWPGFISISGNTGERVCMRGGCGYGHGFKERDEIIEIKKLINITEQRRKEELENLKQGLSDLLNSYEMDGIISSNTVEKIFEILESSDND